MVLSKLWFQAALLTFALGFGVLGFLAWRIQAAQPPIPHKVTSPDHAVLFTSDDIMAGQHIFQKYGLMQFGTLFGHGAYLGPDFTAQYLHLAAVDMVNTARDGGLTLAEAEMQVERELKSNLYQADTGILPFTTGQARAFGLMRSYYQSFFADQDAQTGLRRPSITDPAELGRLTAYFAWAAWVASALRPDTDHSYTNNWPPEPLAGNRPTPQVFLWSVLSLIALLGGTGLVLFFVGKYDLLGWRHSQREKAGGGIQFRPPEQVHLTPAQRATAWYFLVVACLFLVQGLLGGANAHYHVEPASFYGANLGQWLPYNLTRVWHLQLALFFVAASFLAMGIFITPMIAGHEPRHQDKLALALFAAIVLVVVGSLIGEAASYKDVIRRDGPWFWLGAQGWEYLDLGRLWQILLVVGMFFWVAILARGLWRRLQGEHPANMPALFLYSALSIPIFYAAGLAFGKGSSFPVIDFWRFWVVHLWVEDFLELFTTIMVAYVFVLLGVVRPATATRVVYLDIILYSVGGVIGTMHHLYFSGAPALHMALGATFSAMEVIPLVLLSFEAWRFMQLGSAGGESSALATPSSAFPHKWAVMFLIAVGFWNFLGAGVFGFLINLPIVSYYEIGTQWTANHGHGAMMGVYGMLAIGFFMFVARHFIPADRACDRAMAISFWGLNIGLLLMVVLNLLPIGGLQIYDAFANGYWHARDAAFFQRPIVRVFEWLRLPGDVLFIVAGIFPVVYLALRMFANRKRVSTLGAGEPTEAFTSSPLG
jgi:nitric oxide reductase subunit B